MWFKNERAKRLEAKERELMILKLKIDELKWWCASDSPEIGFSMLYLQSINTNPESVSSFRDKLRKGVFSCEEFKKIMGRKSL